MPITVKRPEDVVEFCTDLSARAEWELAQKNLEEARQNASGDNRLADTRITEAARAVQAAEAAMGDSVLLFRLRALRRKEWQEKVAAHPPREGNDRDTALGVNQSTFFDDLLSTPGTIVSVTEKATGAVVDFDPTTEWSDLADDMTDGQYAEFAQAVLQLNRAVVARPFSRSASLAMRGSEQNSKQPND